MRYKDTRADDKIIGTAGDDFIKIARGGLDKVNGGNGFDRLKVDYHDAENKLHPISVVEMSEDGSLSGYLAGGDDGRKFTSFVTFQNIERLTFIGTSQSDYFHLTVNRAFKGNRVSVDLGDGVDQLSLVFGKAPAQTVDARVGGVVETSVGTFGGIEFTYATLTRHADLVYSGSGDDQYFGRAGDDIMYGFDGQDALRGERGADTLDGGSGYDNLYGGRQGDVMTGGSDADAFIYVEIADSTIDDPDTILDFSHAEGDHLRFSDIDVDPNTPKRQAFVFIDQQQFTGPGGTDAELRQQDNGDGTVTVQGDTNHDGIADFAILVHTDTLLVKADLIL